jgi:4-hydroxy-tetrahydrodipicolinate reductase
MHGATGRMGIRIIQLISRADDLQLSAAVERPGHARLGEDIGPIAGLDRLGVPLSDALAGSRSWWRRTSARRSTC